MSKIQQCIIWNCYGNLCAKKWLLLFYEKKVVSDKKSRQLRRGQVRRNFTNIQSYKFRKHARLIFLLLKILLNFQKVISLDFCFLLCLLFFFFCGLRSPRTCQIRAVDYHCHFYEAFVQTKFCDFFHVLGSQTR